MAAFQVITEAYGASSTVSGYSVDPNTGALTQLPGSPFAGGLGPFTVTVNQSGKFVYVANGQLTTNNVSAYQIDPTTGELSQISGSPFVAGTQPLSVVAYRNFLYV